MITDWELWACANEAIRQHGGGALAHADERMAALLAAGDEAGALTWTAIRERIERLQNVRAGDRAH